MKIQLPTPYRGQCIFCKSSKQLTDEHVISKSVRRNLPKTESVIPVAGNNGLKPETALNIVLSKAVCARCNNGWMSRVEKDFVRIFKHQLYSLKQRFVDSDGQKSTATWAVKVALLIQLYTSAASGQQLGHFVPDSHLQWLGKETSPPPETIVWIAAIHNPIGLAHCQPSSLATSRDTTPDAYFVSFSVGHLLFNVFGPEFITTADGNRIRPQTLGPPKRLAETLIEIWPGNSRDLMWPPMKPVLADELRALEDWPSEALGIPTERLWSSHPPMRPSL